MKWSSLVVLVCALLMGVALVAAETESQAVAAADFDFAQDQAVDEAVDEDEAEAEDEDEVDAEDESESEAEDESESEAEDEAEDDVFVALAEAAAGKAKAKAAAASNAEADTELSEAFDRIVQHQIEQNDAAEAEAAAEDAHLNAAASAAVESTLAAAHISVPAVLNAADESMDESSLVEADAAAEVVLDVDADLGAELEVAAANEQLMDQWLDAEMGGESEAEAEAEAEGPLDADPVDALIADAPALPRDAVKIVAPKPKKPVSKKVAKKIAAKKRAARRAAIAAGKPVPKKLQAKKQAVPFIDPRVVRKWKNIKETTIAYLRAVRKHVKSKYGTSSAALVAGGVKATREVYTICLKYGRNKFLCAVLRDLFLKNYVRADVDLFAKKTGKRFVRENMKKIIKFTHHHVRHPHEFTGEYMNQKFLVDPFTACPKRMGREIRKFLRALRYAVTEKHPDLTHELVDDFNTVFATAKKRCAKLQSAVEFNHPLCDVLLRVMNKKFATKDVFLDRQVRKQFVRVVKKRVKRARNAERKAKGLPKIDPLCDPKGAAKAERKLKKQIKKKEAAAKLAAQAAALAVPAAPAAPAAAAAAAAATPAPAAAAANGDANAHANSAAEQPRRHGGRTGASRGGRGGSSGRRGGSRGGNGSKGRSNLLYSKINAAVTKDRYEITIRLGLDYNTVARTPEDLEAFIRTFAADTSRALGVAAERVSVTAVQAADAGATGINVKFLILPDASAPNGASDPKNSNSVDAIADKFAAQTQDSKSTLMQSPILSKLATDSQVSLTKQQTTSTGKSAASANAVVSAALVALLSVAALAAARF